MKWTEMVIGIALIAAIVYLITGAVQCEHQRAKMKLECMQSGKLEAECRYL